MLSSKSLGILAVLAATVTSACGERRPRTVVSAGPPTGSLELTAEVSYRAPIEHEDAIGISGSCWDGSARWLVAERRERMLRVDRQGRVESIPIEGLPPAHDLEGLACGSDGTFYVSTETRDVGRTQDRVLVVEVSEGVARVVDTLIFHYPAPMKAGEGHGLEGLCIAGDWLIAAGEIQRTNSAGVRQAPILRQRLGEPDTFIHWVNLTSRTGKVSALDCRERGGIIEMFAIERDFEIHRILQFELGDSPSKIDTMVDLAPVLGETENIESIIVEPDGRVWLSNDNQYKTITDPTAEVILEPIPAFAH